MKRLLVCSMAISLVLIPLLHAQERPTLGPAGPESPSLLGPGSSRTNNPRLLVRMRRIYVQRIDHNLNEILTKDLAHVSWVKVVNKSSDADAVVRGTCFTLRRLKSLHTEVYITDRITGVSIWQDVVLVPYDPPVLSKAVDKAAAQVLADLNHSFRVASRR